MPTAANNHGAPDMLRELGAWAGDFHSPGVASGGLPPVPYNSLTLDPCATRAYVRGALGDLIYIDQGAVSVGPLNQGNGTYYLAIHRSASRQVSGWTRQVGTQYLWGLMASQPADPAEGLVLASVTVAGGIITATAGLAPGLGGAGGGAGGGGSGSGGGYQDLGALSGDATVDVTAGAVVALASFGGAALTLHPSGSGQPGQFLTFMLTSDPTGGALVTFAAPFHSDAVMTLTASKVNTVQFVSNGTGWYEVARITVLS